jgi:hypothetical protein
MNMSYVELESVGGPGCSVHPKGQFHMAASIVDEVHLVNSSQGAEPASRLMVGFPDMVSGFHAPMARVRVFGESTDILNDLLAKTFTRLAAQPQTLPSVRKAAKVPEATSSIAFVRNRSQDSQTTGYAARSLARAQRKTMDRVRRGETVLVPPMSMESRMERILERCSRPPSGPRAFLIMHSRSTGQRFSLGIEAIETSTLEATISNIDAYGLSCRANMTGIPNF